MDSLYLYTESTTKPGRYYDEDDEIFRKGRRRVGAIGKMRKRVVKIVLTSTAAVVLVFFPDSLHADAGIPMLAVVWPLSWFAFIPIVAIETIIAWKHIALSLRNSLTGSLVANVISTLVGIPVTWGLLLVVEMMATHGGLAYGSRTIFGKVLSVALQAPWLMTYGEDQHWMVPAAMLFLLPFFGVTSVFLERPIFRKLSKCEKEDAKHWSWMANAVTYGISILTVLVWFVFGFVGHA